MNFFLFSFFLLLSIISSPVLSIYVLDDFEQNGVDNWKGLVLSSDIKHSGSHSGCWENTSSPTSVFFNVTKVKSDWSAFTLFSMWVYSAKADNSGYQVILDSDNSSTPESDYYSFSITADWKGWKEIKRAIPSEFSKSRSPL